MQNYFFLLVLFAAVFVSIKKNKLTISAALTGGVIACLIFMGAGFTGIAMLGIFFILGTVATAHKIKVKENLEAAENNSGRRTTAQVIANGGIAGLLGLFCYIFPEHKNIYQLMMAASLASATADTLSSELGTVYGKKFYNILSLHPGTRGANGVVSAEGTLLGIGGSIIIAVVYAIGFSWSNDILWIVLAGTIGNIADSVLGATLERKQYLDNDAVNLLNTMIAATAAWVIWFYF